jgi:hypothetical protein
MTVLYQLLFEITVKEKGRFIAVISNDKWYYSF